MPPVTRLGDVCSGHGCWPSRPNDTASPNVYANNIPIHRQSDHWVVHCCPPPCHDGVLAAGSPTVYINNLQCGRIGDPVSCGSTVATGSPNVFAGDGQLIEIEYEEVKTISVTVNGKKVTFDKDVANKMHTDDPYSDPQPLAPPPAPETIIEEDATTPENQVDDLPAECDDIPVPCPENFSLTPNFTLAQLSSSAVISKTRVRAQHGLTEQEIICNLRALAKNVLEPLAAQFGRDNMYITSGFRLARGKSQHERGQAVDVQFLGWSKDDYWEAAKWIKNNINYDQFIYEYRGNMPWFHLSYNKNGNRPFTASNKFGTMPGQGYVWGKLIKIV